MGTADAYNYREDTLPHWVELSSFSIGAMTITETQYRAVIGTSRNPERPENHPVIDVSWNDAMEFCRRLTSNLQTLIRLPTEAQWEYAARGPAVNLYEDPRFSPSGVAYRSHESPDDYLGPDGILGFRIAALQLRRRP